MASKRRFYRTVVSVEILSEEPYVENPEVEEDLVMIHNDITNGDCSGRVTWGESQEVDGPTMARLLQEQASDPEFFRLDENGEDVDGDDWCD